MVERKKTSKVENDFLLPGLNSVAAVNTCEKSCDFCCKKSKEFHRKEDPSPENHRLVKTSPESRRRIKMSPDMRRCPQHSPESEIRHSVKLTSQRRCCCDAFEDFDEKTSRCSIEKLSKCSVEKCDEKLSKCCCSESRIERRRVQRRRRSSFVKSAHFPGFHFSSSVQFHFITSVLKYRVNIIKSKVIFVTY